MVCPRSSLSRQSPVSLHRRWPFLCTGSPLLRATGPEVRDPPGCGYLPSGGGAEEHRPRISTPSTLAQCAPVGLFQNGNRRRDMNAIGFSSKFCLGGVAQLLIDLQLHEVPHQRWELVSIPRRFVRGIIPIDRVMLAQGDELCSARAFITGALLLLGGNRDRSVLTYRG